MSFIPATLKSLCPAPKTEPISLIAEEVDQFFFWRMKCTKFPGSSGRENGDPRPYTVPSGAISSTRKSSGALFSVPPMPGDFER